MNQWISYDHERSRLGTFAAVTAGVLLLMLAV
jgi:hypothetical protein